MPAAPLADLDKLESRLWEAADQLRANSKLTSSEYCMPVLGIIFLRHASNRYDAALTAIQADQDAGRMPRRKLLAADFVRRRALMLPPAAHYNHLMSLPKGSGLGAELVGAMKAIEADFPPLEGQLPKEYEAFEDVLLEDLMRIFDDEALRRASGDVFGRIYEYFLMKFAMQGAQDNGEFFTPPSLVQMIVNVIEPDHGIVADLACGSGGMFVQSSHFIEDEGLDTMQRVTFYGREKTATTIRLAKMNLAVHGLEGDIKEANTFYDDVHRLRDGRPLWGNCDFMMANPPFNVDMVDAERIKGDRRLPFGLPGVNKAGKVGNANYLWISYFHSYLSPTGRAGFVMSSQASSAGHGERDLRRKLVETGDVDVMIAIRGNFFYTRTVPCELWHLDRGKPPERRDVVLMLDARQVFRKVTRKIYDFSPEQLENLTAIVWLHRGQRERFLGLVRRRFEALAREAAAVAGALTAFDAALDALLGKLAPVAQAVPAAAGLAAELRSAIGAAATECRDALAACRADAAKLVAALGRAAADLAAAPPTTNEAQHAARTALQPQAEGCRELVKQLDLVAKLASRVSDLAVDCAADKAVADLFERRVVGRLVRQLDEQRRAAVEQLKHVAYLHRQVAWLHERFPDAELRDVPGLVKRVDRATIAAADWSLTPGRYVGVAPPADDEDFDFEQAMRDIRVELSELDREARALSEVIDACLAAAGA